MRSHPAMADAYGKSRKGQATESKHLAPFDYKWEVERCYTHYMKSVRWESDWSYEPNYLDWDKVCANLKKVINRAEDQIAYGNPVIAIDVAFLILDTNIIQYEEDYLYEREDWEISDLCIEECINLITASFCSPKVTPVQKLDVCDRLEQIWRSDLFDYCDVDISEIINNTRNSLMTDDERLAHYRQSFEKECSEWRRESLACEIWDFLIRCERQNEAIKFFKQNRELGKLRNRYVDYLLTLSRENEAIDIVDEAIKLCGKRGLTGSVRRWQEKKILVLERMNDIPAILKLCREMFKNAHGTEVLNDYHKIKSLVSSAEWSEYRDEILKSYDNNQDADSPLSAIYAEEGLVDRLFDVMEKSCYNLMPALQCYAKMLNTQQQKILVEKLEKEIIYPMGCGQTRKSYYALAIRLKELASICPAGRELARKAFNYYLTTYTNRPALCDELSKVRL